MQLFKMHGLQLQTVIDLAVVQIGEIRSMFSLYIERLWVQSSCARDLKGAWYIVKWFMCNFHR